MKQLAKRLIQLAGLVSAGLFAALAVGFYADHRDDSFVPDPRWLGWSGYTALLAVYMITDQRLRRREKWFWGVLVGLLFAHALAYGIVFQMVREWRSVWFVPITIVEYPVFLEVFDRFGKRRTRTNGIDTSNRESN